MLFPPVSFERIRDNLLAMESDLQAMKLHSAPDRLARYVQNLDRLVKANEAQSWEPLGQSPDHEELVWSLVEGFELTEIHRGLKGYDEQTLTKLYRKILCGPTKPSAETATSNEARNLTFELHLGSALRSIGVEIELGRQADLTCQLDNATSLVIECKRPLSISKVRRRIKDARKQLRRRLNQAGPGVAGLVAISASKIINPGANWFSVETGRQLQQLGADLVKLHHQYSSDYDRLEDLRIIGIMWHLLTPAKIEDANIISFAQESLICLSGAALQTAFFVPMEAKLKGMLNSAFGSG